MLSHGAGLDGVDFGSAGLSGKERQNSRARAHVHDNLSKRNMFHELKIVFYLSKSERLF
jgi:hypothetical protein